MTQPTLNIESPELNVELMLHGIEDNIDQRSSSWSATYRFTGKERDSETGFDYFGARYYTSGLSIWLSVDPLADKYPSMSAYMYTAGNPVMLVDPDGRDWFENELTGDVYYNSDMRKGQEGTGAMTGEGWQHMGKNGMFMKDKDDHANNDANVLHNNGVFANSTIKADGTINIQASIKGVKAKDFMRNLGYEFKPKDANVHVRTSTYAVYETNGPNLMTYIDESVDQKTGTYAKKGDKGTYDVTGYYKYTPIPKLTVKAILKQLVTPYRHQDSYEIRRYSYGKNEVKFNSDIVNVVLEFVNLAINNKK